MNGEDGAHRERRAPAAAAEIYHPALGADEDPAKLPSLRRSRQSLALAEQSGCEEAEAHERENEDPAPHAFAFVQTGVNEPTRSDSQCGAPNDFGDSHQRGREPTLPNLGFAMPSLAQFWRAGRWNRRGSGVRRRLGESFVPKAVVGAERFKTGGRAAGGRPLRSSHRLGGRGRLGCRRRRFLLSRSRGRFVGKLHAKFRSTTACGHPALGRLGKLIRLPTFWATDFRHCRRRQKELKRRCRPESPTEVPPRGAGLFARVSRRLSAVERILQLGGQSRDRTRAKTLVAMGSRWFAGVEWQEKLPPVAGRHRWITLAAPHCLNEDSRRNSSQHQPRRFRHTCHEHLDVLRGRP